MRKQLDPFLNIVIDVYFSIVLFSAFTTFPGFNKYSFLMLFSIIIMINYWWVLRSFAHYPKYYLVDFYYITGIMLIFAQWPNYYFDLKSFLIVTAIFYLVDALWDITDIYIHKEHKGKPILTFNAGFEIALAGTYFAYTYILKDINIMTMLLLMLPYAVYFYWSVKKGVLTERFYGEA